MKFLFLIITIFFNSLSVYAVLIKGKVVDKHTEFNLEFAQISLHDLNTGKLIYGTSAGPGGEFVISDIRENKYLFRISFVGYQTIELPLELTAKNSSIDLGQLRLQEISKDLKQLNVTGRKSQLSFEPDKKVFNVDQNLVGAGTSASELLRNIPSVEVTVDGNILLRNNPNVILWINGRPSGLNDDNRAQILEQLPSETIEKVEIISNPSAKNSPDGSAGIINIVLKKSNKKGFYGSVTAGVDTNPSRNFSSNLFMSTNKWDLNLNAGYRNNVKNMFFNSDRISWNPETGDTATRYSRDVVKIDGGGYFARGSATYHASIMDDINLSVLYTTANRMVTEDINNRLIRDGISVLDFRFTDASSYRNYYQSSLDYNHNFNKKGHVLKAFADFNYSVAKGDSEFTQKDSLKNPVYFQWSDGLATKRETTVQLDYIYPISDSLKFEAGYKGEFLYRDNITDAEYGTVLSMPMPQYELSNRFYSNDDRNSVYVNFSGKISKLNWQTGLRAEYNRQINDMTTFDVDGMGTLTVFEYKYPGLYPSVFLDYSLPSDNQLQLSYTRRINRPKGRAIMPFINMADSSNIEYGNPNLKPEYMNAFELSHIKSWEEHLFSTVLYYRTTENVIQWVNYVVANDSYDTKYITPENITNAQNTGLEIILKNKLFKNLDLTSTLNLFYNHLDGFEYAGTTYETNSNFAWNAKIISTLLLPAGITGQISGSYQSLMKIAQGETLPIWGIDMAFRKSFLENKLIVSLTAKDLTQTRVSRDISRGYNFYDYSFYKFNASSVGIIVTYNFGKQQKSIKDKEPNPLGGDF